MDNVEGRTLFKQVRVIILLLLGICCLLAVKFTTRTSDEKERARVRVVLTGIHALQQNHHAMFGTYLSSRRANTSDVMKWTEVPGRFRYDVTTDYGTYAARASADLDGDGQREVWQVDPHHSDPVRLQPD